MTEPTLNNVASFQAVVSIDDSETDFDEENGNSSTTTFETDFDHSTISNISKKAHSSQSPTFSVHNENGLVFSNDKPNHENSNNNNNNNNNNNDNNSNNDTYLKVNDYEFPLNKTALMMIDFQRDFLLKGGFGELLGNDVSLLKPCIKNAKNILNKARNYGIKIIHTLESHESDLSNVHKFKLNINDKYKIGDNGPMGRILIKNEYGNNIINSLKPLPNEKIIYKPGKGAFYNTDLDKYLRDNNITHLIFAGVTTEVCVFSTMCEARDRGYYCLLLNDSSDSYFPNFKKYIEEMIVAQGNIVGWIAKTNDLIHVLDKNIGKYNINSDIIKDIIKGNGNNINDSFITETKHNKKKRKSIVDTYQNNSWD